MKIRHAVSFLAFGVIVAFGIYYIGSLGVRIGLPEDRVDISMKVPDTNSVVVGSSVLLRGVPVGKVTAVRTVVDSGIIDFYVDGEHPIPVDTEVRLENLSALGESYIGLMPRTATGPMFHDGQLVATEDIKQPASISEVATSLARVLKQADPDHLRSVIDEADRALPETDAVLPNLTRASMLLRNTVTSMDGRGSALLANFQTLLQNAGWVGPTLAQVTPSLLASAEPLGRIFSNSFGVVYDIGSPEVAIRFKNLMDRIQRFLDDRAPDLKVIAEALTPNIQGITAALMNVDTGQILTNMLAAIPEDGVVTLRVTPQNP